MRPARPPRPPAPAIDAVPAAADEPVFPDDAVEVARVVGAWGVKGGIRVKAHAADPQALFSSKRWFVRPAEGRGLTAARRPPLPILLRVVQAREHGDGIVATCQELTDRDAAEAMAGAHVFVSRASFPTPEENEYYWVDLIGLTVRNRAGTELGTVDTLIETGPHCVLSLRPLQPDAEAVLIPFVDAYVDRVDRAARTIHVDWNADD